MLEKSTLHSCAISRLSGGVGEGPIEKEKERNGAEDELAVVLQECESVRESRKF